ncbi:hypothetical protein 12VC501_gene0010 [Vibrio phage 12VC501]|nr:hypothetical protein 12VC501_gene0010 [Vibrio phage 12VC501]
MHTYDEKIGDMCAQIMEAGFMQSPEGRAFIPEYNQLMAEKSAWIQKMNNLKSRYTPEFRKYLESRL